MSRCIIVGGAKINNYERIQGYINENDFVVYCDCGLAHMKSLAVKPNLIVGDFDSYSKPDIPTETIILPCEKDDTDTVFAVKEAIKRGYTDFLMVGAVGERLDHTLGNTSILLMLDSQGLKGKIIDDYSEMEIVSDKTAFIEDYFSYFSLLNISGTAKGVTIRNAKYNLDNAEITCEYQYGVSNEVVCGKTAEVSVKDGKLLLIKVF